MQEMEVIIDMRDQMILISCCKTFSSHLWTVQQEQPWCKHTLHPLTLLPCSGMRDQV